MTSINLCMALANPVKRSANKEDEIVTNKDLPIKPKEGLINETSKEMEIDRVMVDSTGKPVKTSSVIIEEEEESASWETARCILDYRYVYVHFTSHILICNLFGFPFFHHKTIPKGGRSCTPSSYLSSLASLALTGFTFVSTGY